MNIKLVMTSCLIALTATLFAGCCHCRVYDKEEMMPLGASLKELSTAIEGQVRYNKELPVDISGEELLKRVRKKNNQLFEPFQDYTLRVLTEDKHAIIMVCTQDGTVGLLEDAGCTALMDKHLWEAKPNVPCEFTLKVSEVCTAK